MNGTELEHKFFVVVIQLWFNLFTAPHVKLKVSCSNECNGISSHFDRLEDI